MAEEPKDEKAERRDLRKKSLRERIAKHGKDLGKVYRDAVSKRVEKRKK